MSKPIESFDPILPDPSDYSSSLPNFCNAYICASISKLSRKEAVRAAHSNAAYESAVRATLIEWGVDRAQETVFINSRHIPGSRPGTQGLIFFHQNTAFIVFRSTERQWNDWITDLTVSLSRCSCARGRVHTGFWLAFSAAVPKAGSVPLRYLEKTLGKLCDSKAVWLTGHSLGGALASIAASWLLHSGVNVSGLYTFGAPRVGGGTYRDYLNKLLTYRYWRFIHRSDRVPDLPYRLLGYSREGCAIKLTDSGYKVLRRVDASGRRTVLGKHKGTTWADHPIDLYRDRLLTLCRREDPHIPEMTYQTVSGIELDTTQEDLAALAASTHLQEVVLDL